MTHYAAYMFPVLVFVHMTTKGTQSFAYMIAWTAYFRLIAVQVILIQLSDGAHSLVTTFFFVVKLTLTFPLELFLKIWQYRMLASPRGLAPTLTGNPESAPGQIIPNL